MKSDFDERGRVYFPGVDFTHFDDHQKKMIEDDIKADFDQGLSGILALPKGSKFGVYLAYVYYINLFNKIKQANVQRVKEERIRVKDRRKVYLLFRATMKNSFGFL